MNDITDPRRYDYPRIYNKVPINRKRLFLILIIDLFFSTTVYLLFKEIIFIIIFNIFYYLLCIKYVLIFFVKIYQKIAPICIRSQCRFEPSCSNYMLESLEKYGLIKGLKKGIDRIKRCNINDGGYDYP